MASTVTVVDPTARRHIIKVNPSKYLHEIRAEACLKLHLDPDKYGLKNNNKLLDLSQPYRHSGLPSGAKLELTLLSRSVGVVSIALQLPESESKDVPGGRLFGKFPSTTTLWLLLRKFEAGVVGGAGPRNFTARGIPRMGDGGSGAGRLFHEEPVVNILGRELSSFSDLQKSLSTLGINSGSVLLKLGFRVSETPFEEAQEQIGQYFRHVDGERTGETYPNGTGGEDSLPAPSLAEDAIGLAKEPSPASPETDAVSAAAPEKWKGDPQAATRSTTVTPVLPVPEPIPGLSSRPITVFAPPSSTTPRAALVAHDPSDYEFTLDHAKRQKAAYELAGRNKTLASDAELEAAVTAAATQRAAIKSVEVKVRFPDQTTVVASFASDDTGRDLYSWVKGLMRCGDDAFVLRWASAKGMADVPDGDERLISKVGMVGRVQVTLAWKAGAGEEARRGECLKEEVRDRARELEVKQIAAVEVKEEAQKAKKESKDIEGREKKLPGWLKKSLPGGKR